jgi:hypothetical protein
MRSLIYFLFFFSTSFTLTITENCLLSQNSAKLESHIHEVGKNSKRVFDGYVEHVLTQLPNTSQLSTFNFEPTRWDPEVDPNPANVVLVIVPGQNTLTGKRYKRCLHTKNFDFVIIQITNFNSSNSLCVDELKQIQSLKKRVIANFCGLLSTHPAGYNFYQINNKLFKFPLIFSYEQSENGNLLADYNIRIIIRARQHVNDGTGKCSYGESKCRYWKKKTFLAEKEFEYPYIQDLLIPFHLHSCIGESDRMLCGAMAVPQTGLELFSEEYPINQCCFFHDNFNVVF